ncbi:MULTISPECIES: class I SAM-dependent methyltransferase [Pseudomonas]|jgi:hypothetical protein|uniref:Methyltransferase family protein n=2 Tax=Pseudomonas TaxID=286 RepID=A0A9X8EFV2_PSEPU|nr:MULTISPECIES: class I SAM-dependent methyltransferase [Pseudomonas]KIU45644.1 hypothetical protein QV12_23025 [Pseudomonas putida]KTC24477.1 hypothetical protein AO392_22645 [Pseudomonas putida]MBG8560410.1 class I SAM-dependent methyltransferase [Pseudomonas qingdaonensis]MCO7503426.1 class I SAM-dependent methyltransferase [Pseudomonas sp. VE 267-6A]MCO7528980.1 class I SAM-dependent methyltransferase [Pseudomonas sp. 2]
MKVCTTYRETFYHVLNAVFTAYGKQPVVAELGVLRGENAMKLYQALTPEKMVLIDSWSPASNDDYSPFDQLPPWVEPPEKYAYYYGGPMHEQATFDNLYQQCLDRFADKDNVTVIRADTISAIDAIQPRTGIETFDVVYIDASHQYEFILRDLMYYQELVGPDGFILLNDCCHSPNGTKQNLGVLEALSSFMKRSDFIPLAMTNTDWSDVILVRKNSIMVQLVDIALTNSDIPFVEIPHQLISAAKVVYGQQRINISFA